MPRKPFRPSDEQRRQVEAMSAFGIDHDKQANIIGISVKWLHRHFRTQLDLGLTRANIAVSQSLYQMAVGRRAVTTRQPDGALLVIESATAPDREAAKFWLRTRGGPAWQDYESIARGAAAASARDRRSYDPEAGETAGDNIEVTITGGLPDDERPALPAPDQGGPTINGEAESED